MHEGPLWCLSFVQTIFKACRWLGHRDQLETAQNLRQREISCDIAVEIDQSEAGETQGLCVENPTNEAPGV